MATAAADEAKKPASFAPTTIVVPEKQEEPSVNQTNKTVEKTQNNVQVS